MTACLIAVGAMVFRTWPGRTAGHEFDAVSAVIGLASIVVGLISLRIALRAQHAVETDLTWAVNRLEAAVRAVETEARR